MKEILETGKFYRVGNNLSLDFVNTEIVENGKPKNLLTNFQDFAAWALAMDLIDLKQAQKLVDDWKDQTELILQQAMELREKLREMVLNLEDGAAVKFRQSNLLIYFCETKAVTLKFREPKKVLKSVFAPTLACPTNYLLQLPKARRICSATATQPFCENAKTPTAFCIFTTRQKTTSGAGVQWQRAATALKPEHFINARN